MLKALKSTMTRLMTIKARKPVKRKSQSCLSPRVTNVTAFRDICHFHSLCYRTILSSADTIEANCDSLTIGQHDFTIHTFYLNIEA